MGISVDFDVTDQLLIILHSSAVALP